MIRGEGNNSKLLLRAMHRSSRERLGYFRSAVGNSVMLTNSAGKGRLVGTGCRGPGGLCWEPAGAEDPQPHGAVFPKAGHEMLEYHLGKRCINREMGARWTGLRRPL